MSTISLRSNFRRENRPTSWVPPSVIGARARICYNVGTDNIAEAFAISAARYYAYLRCRRFLDFSSSQTELLRKLSGDKKRSREVKANGIHLVVDEVQDINPVQRELMKMLVGPAGMLTAVGDHRQSIYGFRGAKVEIIGEMWKELQKAGDSEVIDLEHNFRSTPRIIDVANRWAKTITPAGGMKTPG